MSQNLSYINLDSVVNDYLLESEQSVNKYYKCWHLAYRGLEQLGLDAFYRVQSVKLPINANLTVTLPANYSKWTKIGVLNSRGEMVWLDENNNFSTFADLLPGRVEQTKDNTMIWEEWGSGRFINYWNGYAYTNIYGVPSGQPKVGSFKVDEENGVIILDYKFSEHYEYLMLEYVAMPEPREGQDYMLPVQFREALIAWLYWRDGKAKGVRTHMQLGTNRDYKHDYFVERRNAIARWKPIRKQEMYQASQQQSRLAIKS
ncbi:MAG TPA: hypothetical protein PKV73_01095 [Agriterribacter sp.]|nr:hypothetical protein [Agriterribacter sp.]